MKSHTVLYDTRVFLETTSGNEILGELCQGRCGKKKDNAFGKLASICGQVVALMLWLNSSICLGGDWGGAYCKRQPMLKITNQEGFR
jgi:hypothetical protein